MSWSKLLVIALSGALVAGPAFAQDDDDDLMQLSPTKKKTKPKSKARPKVSKPPPPTSNDDELAPLTPSRGELVLKLAPGGNARKARVSIDDREVGSLPVSAQSLSAGEHMVAVRAPGHVTWSKKVTIHPNKPIEILVALEANAAIVSITTDAVGAQVAINGKQVGAAPIEELEVPPGTTTISVRKEGYKDSTQTLKLVAGKEYPISVKLGPPTVATEIIATSDRPENPNLVPTPNEDLGIGTTIEESPPTYTRWYFWVGAAAVVAAVAVGTTVGVSNSQPKSLGEQSICGEGGCDRCIGFTCANGSALTASGFTPFKF